MLRSLFTLFHPILHTKTNGCPQGQLSAALLSVSKQLFYKMISTCRGAHARFILVCGLSLLAISTGTRFLGLSVGLATLGDAAFGLPPEVPHDGIHVLQPFDPADLAKCAEGGSGPSKAIEKAKTTAKSKLLAQRSSAQILPAPRKHPSFLQLPRTAFTSKARAMRKEFICDA